MIVSAATLADIKILRVVTLQASGKKKMDLVSVILIMTLAIFGVFRKGPKLILF